MNGFDILQERGFLYQLTDEEEIKKQLNAEGVTFYVGFDPTANSLHIGHLLPIMAMRVLQRAGHLPIALVGGATAMVGDPSGKSEARPILSKDDISMNAEALRKQLSRFIDFGTNGATLVNNINWLSGLNYIDFLRDFGRHFSVNRMLAAESVKQRLETGLSFLEFNYSLLQAYDFYVLARERNCVFQLGGQDQWGNIVAGVDLVRRMLSKSSYGATFPLLTDSQGNKFGKSVAGAVWLDTERTSEYDYYQFWRNVGDGDVARLLGYFTDLPMSEVTRLGTLPSPEINRAKEILAYEATVLAHGVPEATRVFLASAGEFGFADPDKRIATSSGILSVNHEDLNAKLPTLTLTQAELGSGIWIAKLFNMAGLAKSNGDARRVICGGGAYLNDKRLTDVDYEVTVADFSDGQLVLRSGKKNIKRVVIG